MRPMNNAAAPRSSVSTRLDGVQLSEHDRDIAKAYLSKTEVVIDLLWLAGAAIRAAFARRPANGIRGRDGLGGQERVVIDLP